MQTAYSISQQTHCGISVYGIRIQSGDRILREYPYVSPAQDDVVTLLRQMQQEDVAPVHYDDIVKDFLYLLFLKKLQYNGLND